MDRSEGRKMSIAARASRDARVERAPILCTPLDLLRRLDLSSFALGDAARLVTMRQNPADNYHWSKPVGEFTAGEVREAIAAAFDVARQEVLREAREALLDMIADAGEFDEQPDEDATYYTLKTTDRSLRPLLEALGITTQRYAIETDGDGLWHAEETLGEALEREIMSPTPADNHAADDTGSERSEHRHAQINTSLRSEEKEETR